MADAADSAARPVSPMAAMDSGLISPSRTRPGKVVCTLIPPSHAGMNQVLWSLHTYAPQAADTGDGGRGGSGRSSTRRLRPYLAIIRSR